MDAIWDAPFAEDYEPLQEISIKLAEDPQIKSPTVFLALIDIPKNDCTIAMPGRWVLRVSYQYSSALNVVIETTAVGRYNARTYIALDNELNFPLREVNLNGVYWKIQKVMQNRMDRMNEIN